MANGPQDYRDPKVTSTGASGTTTGSSSGKWLWYILGALLVLLLLGWLLGLFSGADEADEVVVTEEPAATAEQATTTEEPAAATQGAATTTTVEPAAEGETATTTEGAATEDAATEDGTTEPAATEPATEDATATD
jgi:hypothetical protein